MVVFLHEVGAVERIIGIVIDEAKKAGGIRPVLVVLEVGSMSGYSPESIVFYFDLMKNDYDVMRDCIIEVNMVPAKIRCDDCGAVSDARQDFALLCPKCGLKDVNVVSGNDAVVKRIEGE